MKKTRDVFNIPRTFLPFIIKTQQDKIFSVVFTKKNGEKRKMSCRKGVKKNLKNGSSPLRYGNHFFTRSVVYDVTKKDYRMINLETVETLKGKGIEYRVID